ncbi:MAG: hypothetical protein MSH16_01285 [Oscillospiraceae bacterium]|nr:hypothetical protein [Oscillospiraceae bacterium]
MTALEKLQKIFHVFRVLAKAAMILCFVAAGLAVAALVCLLIWKNGTALYLDGRFVAVSGVAEVHAGICALLSAAVMTLTDGVLFLFAWQYLKAEEAAGTPFTVSGADTVKKLGIRIIVLPLVAVIISAVIYGCFGLTPDVDISSGGCVITGGVLILVSLIFRYGAELEEAGHEQI